MRGRSIDAKYTQLDAALAGGPVADWLRTLGTEPLKAVHRPGHQDIVSSSELPTDTTQRLRLMHAIKVGSAVRFGYGVHEFTRTSVDGKREHLARVVFFRPPAASAIPVITEAETGDQYIMLTGQLRDGTGTIFHREAMAGTHDIDGEKIKEMILREMSEELPLTQKEIAGIHMSDAHGLLYVSPGGTTEAIAGFTAQLTLSKARMDQLSASVEGHDAGEAVQAEFIALPHIPSDTDLSIETFESYRAEWDALMQDQFKPDGNDMKTFVLMQELRRMVIDTITDRLNKKHRAIIQELQRGL